MVDLIKKEGIDFNESLAANLGKFSTSNTGYRQSTIEIRDDLAQDYQETQNKITEHKTKLKDYESWVEVLANQGSTHFSLNQDDYLYFFVK